MFLKIPNKLKEKPEKIHKARKTVIMQKKSLTFKKNI